MKNIIKLAASFLVLTILVGAIPAGAMAKSENSGKGNGKDKVSIEVVKKSNDSDDKSDDNSTTSSKNKGKNKEQVEGEKKGAWARIISLLTFGAGKSGKVPPGLLHAPGIQKKIGSLSTTTIPVSFPGITNISVTNVSSTSAKISWKTNKATSDALYFSKNTPVGTTSSATVVSAMSNTAHTATLTGLSASTTYYYRIVATDNGGKVASTSDLSFKTASAGTPVVIDVTAPVISNINATTTMNGTTTGPIHVTWVTNEPATSKVTLGTSTPVVSATSTQVISNGALVVSHDVVLPTLEASTTYYMMLSSTDAAGNTSTSAEFGFTVQ